MSGSLEFVVSVYLSRRPVFVPLACVILAIPIKVDVVIQESFLDPILKPNW